MAVFSLSTMATGLLLPANRCSPKKHWLSVKEDRLSTVCTHEILAYGSFTRLPVLGL